MKTILRKDSKEKGQSNGVGERRKKKTRKIIKRSIERPHITLLTSPILKLHYFLKLIIYCPSRMAPQYELV